MPHALQCSWSCSQESHQFPVLSVSLLPHGQRWCYEESLPCCTVQSRSHQLQLPGAVGSTEVEHSIMGRSIGRAL